MTDVSLAKLKITPNAKINNELDREHESIFSMELQNELENKIKIYQQQFAVENVLKLNVDDARYLYKPYADDINFRLRHTPATKSPAGAFIGYLYDLTLNELKSKSKSGLVVFSAGGTSSGKTTAIKHASAIPPNTILINDSNLANYKIAKKQIEKAFDAGQKVLVIFIYREAKNALIGALKRAQQEGRTASIKSMAERHAGAIETCKRLILDFKNHKEFSFIAIDNNGKFEEIVPYIKKEAVAFLESKGYNEKKLVEELYEILEREHDSGKISEDIYNGFKR